MLIIHFFDTFSEEKLTPEPKENDEMVEDEVVVKPATPPKPLMRTGGNFVVLNKHNMSQFKKVKCIPASKIRKVVFPRGNVRCFNASGRLSSIDSKPRFLTGTKTNVPRFQNFTRLSTLQNNQRTIQLSQLQTNGDAKNATKPEVNGHTAPQKSGILIKRNHLKNITVRKVNVVQPNIKRGNTVLSSSIGSTKNNIKNDSIASLVADLEN